MLIANLWLFFYEATGIPTPPPPTAILQTTILRIDLPELVGTATMVLGS
jgi:hypothetical protein